MNKTARSFNAHDISNRSKTTKHEHIVTVRYKESHMPAWINKI